MPTQISENFPALKWKRPDSKDYPKVWYTFKARDVDSDNLVEYRIQDLPLDRVNDLLKHLINSFIADEPIRQAVEYEDDPYAIEDFVQYLRPVIAQRMALVCFKEGSDEIVGANMLYVNTKDDTISRNIRELSKGSTASGMFEMYSHLWGKFDTFERFNVDQYMSSMGLSVDGKYRGRGIGNHFFNSRLALCREFGITLIQHTCTSDFSNVCADRAGYNIDIAWSYTDIVEKYPEFQKIANTNSKKLTLRSIVVQADLI